MTINLYWSLVQVFSIDNHAPTYDHPTYDNPNLRSVFPKENLYSRSTEFATKTPLKKNFNSNYYENITYISLQTAFLYFFEEITSLSFYNRKTAELKPPRPARGRIFHPINP